MTEPNPDPEDFGDPRVNAAAARLDDLEGCPVGDHVEVFEDIHERFRDALADASAAEADDASS